MLQRTSYGNPYRLKDNFLLWNPENPNTEKQKTSQESLIMKTAQKMLSTLPFECFGPWQIHEPLKKTFYFKDPAISVSLFLDGFCNYTIQDHRQHAGIISKNMFLIGRWQEQTIALNFPKQSNCLYVNFTLEEPSFEKYFGRGLYYDIQKIIEQVEEVSLARGGIISGISKPDAVHIAKRITNTQQANGLASLQYWSDSLSLLTKIFQNVVKVDPSPCATLQNKDIKQFFEMKSFIEQNFASIKSTSEVCHSCGMSVSKAHKGFKAIYLITIGQYIKYCKMSFAYSMLMRGKYNVSECAFAVGYSNVSHFISSFKKCYGVTPKSITMLCQHSF